MKFIFSMPHTFLFSLYILFYIYIYNSNKKSHKLFGKFSFTVLFCKEF